MGAQAGASHDYAAGTVGVPVVELSTTFVRIVLIEDDINSLPCRPDTCRGLDRKPAPL